VQFERHAVDGKPTSSKCIANCKTYKRSTRFVDPIPIIPLRSSAKREDIFSLLGTLPEAAQPHAFSSSCPSVPGLLNEWLAVIGSSPPLFKSTPMRQALDNLIGQNARFVFQSTKTNHGFAPPCRGVKQPLTCEPRSPAVRSPRSVAVEALLPEAGTGQDGRADRGGADDVFSQRRNAYRKGVLGNENYDAFIRLPL
jgi:hypothetical protein